MSVPLGREAIWGALFNLLLTLSVPNGGKFVTVQRRVRHWTDVAAGEQPYLALLQHQETAIARDRGMPTKWELAGKIIVYARSDIDQLGTSGGQVLNPLIDAVEGALAPVPAQGNVQSLAGLVSRVFIDGVVEVDEGNLDNQAVAIIPVRIIAPV